MVGSLDVPNIAKGHLSFKFDNSTKDETAKAKRVIEDMLQRGYSIFVEDEDGELHKVDKFDAEREVYIIKTPRGRPKSEKKAKKEVPLRRGRATGVAPTAGG